MIASVIINVPNSSVDQQYDYIVPKNAENIISVGTRVKVPFGNGDRTIMGYVLGLKEDTSFNGGMKEILEVLDIEPLLTNTQIELANYIQYDALSPYVRHPPSMVLKTFVAWKLNMLTSPKEPMPLFPIFTPKTCAAS